MFCWDKLLQKGDVLICTYKGLAQVLTAGISNPNPSWMGRRFVLVGATHRGLAGAYRMHQSVRLIPLLPISWEAKSGA